MTEEEKICKKRNYFNFDSLSKRFQVILLELLSKELGASFNKTKNEQYKKHKNEYYVYAEDKDFKDFKSGVDMLLDIVVDQLSVKIELLVTMTITLLSVTTIIKMKSTMK